MPKTDQNEKSRHQEAKDKETKSSSEFSAVSILDPNDVGPHFHRIGLRQAEKLCRSDPYFAYHCKHPTVRLFIRSGLELGYYNPALSVYHAMRCVYMAPSDREEMGRDSPFKKENDCLNSINELREWAGLKPFNQEEMSKLDIKKTFKPSRKIKDKSIDGAGNFENLSPTERENLVIERFLNKDYFEREVTLKFLALATPFWNEIQYVIANGADVNTIIEIKKRQPPLISVIQTKMIGGQEKLKCLLEFGADPNALDLEQNSPLHYATFENDIIAAKLLLEFGADANTRNMRGYTPLYIAARLGHYDFVTFLLQSSKADPSIADNRGFTPLNVAADSGFQDVVDILQ